MRIIKLGLISIILLAGIITAISFLFPSTVVVRRSVDIVAPVDTIFARISHLQNWKGWLVNRDSLPITISTENGREELVMGNTTVYISSIKPKEIITQWQVKKGKVMPGYFDIIDHPKNAAVTVQWEFSHRLRWYPWEKFSSIITEKVLGPFMEQSLSGLKQVCEAPQ